MNKEGILKIVNEKGEEKEFNILFTFDIKEKNKGYVIYTDYSKNENGNIKVFSGMYNVDEDKPQLKPVVDEDEIKIISNYLKKLSKN